MSSWPRVAFFSDSYTGIDGVATTCRNIAELAQKQNLPFLSVYAAEKTRSRQTGATHVMELDRGPISLPIDRHLKFDLLFSRHYQRVLQAVGEFRPDVVHITGPGDVGITGARVAHALRLPLVASWHTNLHEFAGRRISRFAAPLPDAQNRALTQITERSVLAACLRFYRIARVLMAPNEEHIELLRNATKKPVFPMRRGIDTQLFSPLHRDVQDRTFRIGFVGRLCPEKNVRFLARLEDELRQFGFGNYRFLIVGDGGERPWLERNLTRADFTGELRGGPLARAYANMDLFVFPSETDTFGNVVSEAMASGVPVVVTSKGGPKYQVQQGVTGFIATDERDFLSKVRRLMGNPDELSRFRKACRAWACGRTWSLVLDDLCVAYQASFAAPVRQQSAAVLAGI